MAKLPQSPDHERLRAVTPSLITLDVGVYYRIYYRAGPYPTLWNRFRQFGPVSRFDHHWLDEAGRPFLQQRGILYAATDIPTAVAEFFQHNRWRINRARRRPWLVAFELNSEMVLLNLTDTFCVRVGASMKLVSGPFRYAQNWSRGFYDAYPQIHGLYYPSSLTNHPTVALYERADIASAETRFHRSLDDSLMLKPLILIAEEIGYGLM